MTEPLAAYGIASAAVPLPSCGETGAGSAISTPMSTQSRGRSLQLRRPWCYAGTRTVGMVITQAGADQRVAQLVYVTSMMPEAGQVAGRCCRLHAGAVDGSRKTNGYRRSPRGRLKSASYSCRTATRRPCGMPWRASRVSPRCHLPNHPCRSPGRRSPRRTSCAPRTSPSPPSCSAGAPAPAPG